MTRTRPLLRLALLSVDGGHSGRRARRRPRWARATTPLLPQRPRRARPRAPTSCAASTAAIAPTTTSATTTSTCGSTRRRRSISGKNSIRFRMLKDDTRIQIDLYANLAIEKILMDLTPLKFERELNAVFVDFPEPLRGGARLHDRLALFGHAARDRAVRRVRVRHRSRPASRGSPPRAKARARASGGRTRISGATSPTAWS